MLYGAFGVLYGAFGILYTGSLEFYIQDLRNFILRVASYGSTIVLAGAVSVRAFLFHFIVKVNVKVTMFCSSCGAACAFGANFCHLCGWRIAVQDEDVMDNLENKIKHYFQRGYPYKVIVSLLTKQHGIAINVRTLKRKLKEYGLRRRGVNYNEEMVRNHIAMEMQNAGTLAGYRYVWHALRLRHYIHVPRRVVAAVMKEIDPDAARDRRARRLVVRNYISFGPNFVWHIDGMAPRGNLIVIFACSL